MQPLDAPIRAYAWGSRTAIAAVQGRAVPSDGPEAELWMGAHPAAPSTVPGPGGPVSLTDVVAGDPDGTLGPARRFGRLPFLLKLLAADAPLSLQAHPDAAQARAGFDAEQAAGVPVDAPRRNYRDPYHKPEMLCAVTDFDALCGFRPPAEAARRLAALAVPGLAPVVAALQGAEEAGALRTAITALLRMPADDRVSLVEAAVTAAGRRLDAEPSAADASDARLLVELGRRYPGDAGVLVALLLNRLSLRRGQVLYAPAGHLHAYLRGVGVELMAASDNVLRGGLTPKHVDVDELLRVLRFAPGAPPVADPQPVAPGIDTWPGLPGVEEFALRRARVGGPHARLVLPGEGPRILFCLTGTVLADDGTGPLTLPAGRSAFVPADRGAVTLTGLGDLYQAGTAGRP